MSDDDKRYTFTNADGSRDETTELADTIVNYYVTIMGQAYERIEKWGAHGLVDPDEIKMFAEYEPARRARDRDLLSLLLFGRLPS